MIFNKALPPHLSKCYLPLLLIFGAGLLYLFTLDTGLRPDELSGGDLITHQYAQVEARPSNAPGYPLYVVIGWLWYRIGRLLLGFVLNPVQILSLYSTWWGLASLWVLYHLLYREEVTGRNWLISALLTAFYASTYFFWYYSVTTEQYSSAIFQTLLLVWLAFAWERDPSDKTLLTLAFLSGTMLANMLTTLFIVPPLFYLIFTKRPRILLNPKLVVACVLAGFAPAVSYIYVYIRGAQHPEWRGEGNWGSTAEWFWQFVSTQQGRDELVPGLSVQNLITSEFPALIWHELTWPVLLAGLLGLALLGRRMAVFFFGTLFVYALFVTAYRFGNWFQVILPIYPLIVLGFGHSLYRLQNWAKAKLPQANWLPPALAIFLLVLVGYRFALSYPRAKQSHLTEDTGLKPGWAILADMPRPYAGVSASYEEWLALQYLQIVWQAEPAITLLPPGQPAEYISKAAMASMPNLNLRAVYPQAVGQTLIQLRPDPLTELPASVTSISQSFGPDLHLRGYSLNADASLVQLYWESTQPIAEDYTISVRLWRDGQPLSGLDGPLQQDHQPVWGVYPTSQWQANNLIADAYTFPSLETKPNHLQIVVYRAIEGGFENLGVVEIMLN